MKTIGTAALSALLLLSGLWETKAQETAAATADIPLSRAEDRIYTTNLARYTQDVNHSDRLDRNLLMYTAANGYRAQRFFCAGVQIEHADLDEQQLDVCLL